MDKVSLRSYLFTRLRSLYEDTHELQQKALVTTLNEEETNELNRKNAQLIEIKNVIEICKSRHKY